MWGYATKEQDMEKSQQRYARCQASGVNSNSLHRRALFTPANTEATEATTKDVRRQLTSCNPKDSIAFDKPREMQRKTKVEGGEQGGRERIERREGAC